MEGTALVENKRQVLRALWRECMHVEPRALELSPAAVRRSYEHVWAPANLWQEALESLPLGLLRLWQQCGRGHLVFTAEPSEYRPGLQDWQGAALAGVCYLCLADLRQNRSRAMWATLALVDHLLGSGAAPAGGWFSEGQGANERLQAAATRFVGLHALGYGAEELDAADARGYFTHSLELYLTLPRRLSVLAPQVHRLYRYTLMREAWWPS